MVKKRKNSSVQLQIWNMNGGNVPEDVITKLEAFAQELVKDSQNPRLLMNFMRG